MEGAHFREVLYADVAAELGILDVTAAAAALARVLGGGTGGVLDGVPEADRMRVTEEVDRLIAEAKGDAFGAVLSRGVDRAIPASLKPEISHALADAGARVRAPLRLLDERRYVGFLPIGEGGMGVVYLALDTELNRRVAFKMIRTGSRGPLDKTPSAPPGEMVNRFLQEAWITGGLEHPGIVPVYELGETPSGVPYYTMRLVRGERTLDHVIREAKTPEDRLALLEPFLKVCDAVRYAHSHGVVHRDLKPANVAIGAFGEVVVLDWGLAKVGDRPDLAGSRWQSRIDELRQETDLKTLTSALGTPGYMAPEAALGQVSQVDARSDVFSLGAILFRILCGRLPFDVTTFVEYVADVVKAVERVPGAPSGLEPICLRALARNREDRYADADELAAAIRRWQAESAVEREVRGLLQEAETAMEGAKGLSGVALLSQLDRALALSARVLDLRPDHEGARGTRERAVAAREGAIGERERLARRRQMKRVAVAGLAIAVVTSVAVALALDAKRRDAEQARAETQAALGAKARALDEVLRLADSKKVRDLAREADRLWPVHPDSVPAMAAWLDRANAVLRNRSDHAEAFARVRERAEPYTEEERGRDHAEEIRRLAAIRAHLAQPVEEAGDETKREIATTYRESMETEARNLDAAIAVRGSWRFDVAGDDWRHDVLSDLIQGLDTLSRTSAQVEMRRESSMTLRARSIDAHRAEWDRTIAGIAASPRYAGLRITPQIGLVPLGTDPESGLFEFAHLGSGEVPTRDPETKRLVLRDDFAIVLVLVPGGTFRMGAQSKDPGGPNFDPQAEDDEAPLHMVTLSPYFLAKHECTQAQWEAMTGARPSAYHPGHRHLGKRLTVRNPVETVSWDECMAWLPRWRLALPTESQWEYACRAGTDTPWWCGPEVLALAKAANLADQACKNAFGQATWRYETWDDGQIATAPVGSFAANPFGFFDVHGNVWEWCFDLYVDYSAAAVTDPAYPGPGSHVHRGGAFNFPSTRARSAHRNTTGQSIQSDRLGCRPARLVDVD